MTHARQFLTGALLAALVLVIFLRGVGAQGPKSKDRNGPLVADHAQQALIKLSGEDLGPEEGAEAMDWWRASKRWETWAGQQPSAQGESAS